MRKALLLAATCALVAASASAMTVHLASPADGSSLRGGSIATLDWSAVALPREAEEWEAFLSVNGGAYYAFRITPHLDIERREVTWTVPNVDAADARILIRVGDERDETGIELPLSFSIVRDPSAGLPKLELAPQGEAEAAREGEAEVIAWAFGDRSGSRVTQQWGYAGGESRVSRIDSVDRVEIVFVAPAPHPFVVPAPQRHEIANVSERRPRTIAAPHASDILLTSSRLNI